MSKNVIRLQVFFGTIGKYKFFKGDSISVTAVHLRLKAWRKPGFLYPARRTTQADTASVKEDNAAGREKRRKMMTDLGLTDH